MINELSPVSDLLSKAMGDCSHYSQLNIILRGNIQKSACYQQIKATQFYSIENISIFSGSQSERKQIKMKEFPKKKLAKHDVNSDLSSNHKHAFPLSSKSYESTWKNMNVCDTNNFYRLQRFYAPLICNSQTSSWIVQCVDAFCNQMKRFLWTSTKVE